MTRRLSTASPAELEPSVSLATNGYPLGSSVRAHEGSRASVERGLQAPATVGMAANSPQGQIGGQEGDTPSSGQTLAPLTLTASQSPSGSSLRR